MRIKQDIYLYNSTVLEVEHTATFNDYKEIL